MKKRVVLSVLENNESLAKVLGQDLARVGLDVSAHLWSDDLSGMAWAAVGRELCRPDCRAWIVAGSTARFSDKVTRQGLSLAALCAQAEHGSDFPILLSPSTGSPDMTRLPTALAAAEAVSAGLGAKAAARASLCRGHRPEYRLRPYGLPGLGLWFEIGPAGAPWQGAFLGAGGAVPDAHGVGPAGTIPACCTLHYPVRGLKFKLDGTDCEAWGTHNSVSPAESYYTRLTEVPESLAFGPFPETDEAEVFTVRLC